MQSLDISKYNNEQPNEMQKKLQNYDKTVAVEDKKILMYFRGERLDWGNGLRDAGCHGKVQEEYDAVAIYNSKCVSPISNKKGLGRVCTCWVNWNSVVLLLAVHRVGNEHGEYLGRRRLFMPIILW